MSPTAAPPTLDAATLAILWSRLDAIVDEMWTTVRRTAFSTIISSALDFGCGILDARGGELAQGNVGMASFNLAMPTLTRDLLRRFAGRIRPGDVFIGNDPWLCIGHLLDVAVITPVFADGRLVAFTATIAHQADIGGGHGLLGVREVYEEGLFLPVLRLYEEGRENETLVELIRANVRTPDLVLADLRSQVSANEVGARRLVRLMSEYGLADLASTGTEMQSRSERAMREVIRALPDGTYRHEGLVDGPDGPVRIPVAVRVRGDEMWFDYAGAPPQFAAGGLNATLSYTVVNTHYVSQCVLAPRLPHNEGSTRPIHVSAPAGSALACTFPAAVNVRNIFTTRVSSVILGALAQVAPDRVIAGYGAIQSFSVRGSDAGGRTYSAPFLAGGGRGGSATEDGIGGFIYTSGAAGVPIEVLESKAPVLVVRKEWQPDSAGAGRSRGGPGQRVVVRRLPGHQAPVEVRFQPTRPRIGAPGLFGGRDGTTTDARWNGEPISPTDELGRDGRTWFRSDADELEFSVCSGGGYGDPAERPPAALEADLRVGIVTPEGAARDYGVAMHRQAEEGDPPRG